MADFALAFPIVMRHEGVLLDGQGMPVAGKTGYTNDIRDPGGETNYGVTKASAVAAGYTGPMADIPWSLVQKIYRKGYWTPMRGDEIPDQGIALELFDTAVNCGGGFARSILRRVLNVFNAGGTRWPDHEDGAPMTLMVADLTTAIAKGYAPEILKALNCLQGARYIELAERNGKLEDFEIGWFRNRVG